MNLPDSGWLDKIGKAPPRVMVGIAVGTGAVWFLDIDKPPDWLKPVFAALCIAATAIVICQAAGAVWGKVRKWRREQLGRKFEALSASQQMYLREIFESGSRDFYPLDVWTDQRWFEELEQWNYVEQPIAGFVVIGGASSRHQVTEKGWRELERKCADSTKPPG